MKKILLGLLGVIVVAVVIVAIIAANKPTAFTIERRITIHATPEAVYAVVSDLRAFPAWSPWQHLDPGMATTHDGAPGTVGATYAWRGNDQVGEGRMTIVRADPNRLIGLRLEFVKPFQATNHVDWRIAPASGGTEMTWAMSGDRNFMMKVASVFMNMDAMVGHDFEQGLANLKRLVERGAH